VSRGSRARLPAQEGSGAATHPAALRGPRIKKYYNTTGVQQGSRVTEVRPRVTEAPTGRAGRRRYHDLHPLASAVGRSYDPTGRGLRGRPHTTWQG
jgi:hypothetical protein